MITYKKYQIETINGSSYIYLNSVLMGCTHSDLNLNNSEEKAMKRIDKNNLKGVCKD
jgi:hypothetical protein